MNRKIKMKIIKSSVLLICTIIVMWVFTVATADKITITTSSAGVMSNKKIGWGIKRNDNHEQPDLGGSNKKMIDGNQDIAMGNMDDKYIYLTFDEGYEAGYTEKILDILKENDVRAAFFITGHYLNTQDVLVKRMIDEGHIVGNHTVNHPSMPDLNDEKLKDEISKLHIAVYNKLGYEMKYLRPPRGEFSQRTLDITRKMGYTTVMWSFAYDDWDENKQGREEYARDKILKNVHNGEVMLLHANSKDNVNILDGIIKTIKSEGYEFKTLDEFV